MIKAPLMISKNERTAGKYRFLTGGGEMSALIRTFDWAGSPLGPVEQWSENLLTCIRIVLTSRQPVFMWWGKDLINIYNDAFRAIAGNKHPAALGQPAPVVWGEIWDQLQPRLDSILKKLDSGCDDVPLLIMESDSALEATSYTFSCSPVLGSHGGIAGILCIGDISGNTFAAGYVKTDISVFTKRLVRYFDEVVRKAGLSLVLNVGVTTQEVYVDRDMWEKIVLRLLSNAFSYTLQGTITVTLSESADQVELTIADTGIGISPEILKNIFKPRRQAETGLGLSFVHELVKLHGGSITASSTRGAGSIFTVKIPIGKDHLPADKIVTADLPVVYKLYHDLLTRIDANISISREKRKLEVSEQHYRQLLQGLPAAVYTCDKEGHILLYNEAAVALWGRTPDPEVDMWSGAWKIYELDGITPIELDNCPMAKAIKGIDYIKGAQIILERPDGTRRIVQSYPDPTYDANGLLTGAVNMLVDITENKAAQEYMSRLAAIVEYSDDAIISKTLEGVVTSWNPAAEKLFGYTEREMLGQTLTRLIPRERMAEEINITDILRSGGRVDHFETNRITKDGHILDISLTISPVKNAQGNIIGASIIARDITFQWRLFLALQESESKYMQLAFKLEAMVEQRTKELSEANYYLEKSNKELEQFAYVTSHDLQEPLRKIHTFAGMLYNSNKDILNESSKTYIEKVMLSARRMSQLINKLLEYSRLVHVQEPFVETDLNEILKNVLSDFEVLISRHKVRIEMDELPRLPVNALQMNQLFHNLLGNALKFIATDRTPVIRVYANLVSLPDVSQWPELDPAKIYYEIVVKDNGIGFEQVYADKIFQIFQRLNERTAFEGTGIGLALCRKIAINHKGYIYAKGVPGEGAEFRVFLPSSEVITLPKQ